MKGRDVPTEGTWRSVPALAAPIEVPATGAPRRVSAHPVHAAAFASRTTGWAVVGTTTPPMSWLLRTDDAGVTWTSQLAWPGGVFGRLRAFDVRRAGLVVGLWPAYSNEINGRPVAVGEPFYSFLVGTQDGGTTWTLGSMPDRQGTDVHFLTPRKISLLVGVPDAYPRTDLARTEDGGATWSRLDGAGDLPMVHIAFATQANGLLIAQDRHRADILYRTTGGGVTWTRQHLASPPGVLKSAETWLFPVQGAQVGSMLTLRAVSRRQAGVRLSWEGTYGYVRAASGWIGPFRLPMPPASLGHDLLARGPDGRVWGAFGHDAWVSDDLAGPWRQRYVPLPDEEHIDDIYPVGDDVLWLTTSIGMAGGSLYRSDDGGGHWTRLTVEAR